MLESTLSSWDLGLTFQLPKVPTCSSPLNPIPDSPSSTFWRQKVKPERDWHLLIQNQRSRKIQHFLRESLQGSSTLTSFSPSRDRGRDSHTFSQPCCQMSGRSLGPGCSPGSTGRRGPGRELTLSPGSPGLGEGAKARSWQALLQKRPHQTAPASVHTKAFGMGLGASQLCHLDTC